MLYNGIEGVTELYDGGWRSDDKEQLIKKYNLTEEEATRICDALYDIECEVPFDDCYDECGFDPYVGGYTYDC